MSALNAETRLLEISSPYTVQVKNLMLRVIDCDDDMEGGARAPTPPVHLTEKMEYRATTDVSRPNVTLNYC